MVDRIRRLPPHGDDILTLPTQARVMGTSPSLQRPRAASWHGPQAGGPLAPRPPPWTTGSKRRGDDRNRPQHVAHHHPSRQPNTCHGSPTRFTRTKPGTSACGRLTTQHGRETGRLGHQLADLHGEGPNAIIACAMSLRIQLSFDSWRQFRPAAFDIAHSRATTLQLRPINFGQLRRNADRRPLPLRLLLRGARAGR